MQQQRRAAAELIKDAEGFGMVLGMASGSLTTIRPLINEDGTTPTPEAQATFDEVSARWDEVARAIRKRARSYR
jgi:hypothetical protein